MVAILGVDVVYSELASRGTRWMPLIDYLHLLVMMLFLHSHTPTIKPKLEA